MDIVYVVGDDSEELRYSLRSLVNLPHRFVFVAGNIPPWITKANEIEVRQNRSPQENSNLNLLKACLAPGLSDDFVFMNDDFYIMQPTKEVENYHQGSLQKRIDGYKSGNRMAQAYSLITTQAELKRQGFTEPHSFELHVPMVMNKHKVIEMFNVAQSTGLEMIAIRPRTFYGNLYSISAKESHDVKGSEDQNERYVSSAGDVPDFVRNAFGAPSPYEVPSSIPH